MSICSAKSGMLSEGFTSKPSPLIRLANASECSRSRYATVRSVAEIGVGRPLEPCLEVVGGAFGDRDPVQQSEVARLLGHRRPPLRLSTATGTPSVPGSFANRARSPRVAANAAQAT